MAEAEPGDADAVAFMCNAPFKVHLAFLSRLSPKSILRMRVVCKAWRKKVWHGPLLSFLHGLQPPRPLICFDRIACTNRYTRLRDYCVESLDLGSDRLRSVLRFTDNENYDFDEYDLKGLRHAPAIDEFRVDYARMERYGQVVFKPQLLVHGSQDGHLLVSSVAGWYVINPATRHWVAVPDLSRFEVVGFYCYEHVPCGEYRVLCFCAKESPAVYGILKVGTLRVRVIGRPMSPAAPADHGLASGVDMSYLSPSIQFSYNRHLHWPPQKRQGYHMLVFDTGREKFSWKRPPPVRDHDMRLFELPTGHLGMSVSGVNSTALELWRLEDYQNEVWVRVYRIQLVLQQMPVLQEEGLWMSGVLSAEGDVLIETLHWLLHCDRNGNLLRKFWFPQTQRLFPVRHMLRESLLPHPMFRAPKLRGAIEPAFFHGLCSDPSSCPDGNFQHLCSNEVVDSVDEA